MIYKIIKGLFSHPLNKNRPYFAIYKFMRWQIQSRLSKRPKILEFIGSVKFYASKGMTGITGNIYNGLHEFIEMSFVLHYLNSEDRFIDIGANVGSYTLLASGYRGCQSLAFEPHPTTFNYLEKNGKLNNLTDKVKLVNCALSNVTGTVNFSSNLDTENHIVIDKTRTKSIPVSVNKLNDYVDFSPNMVKINVEGFETNVIQGGQVLLTVKSLKVIIIELNNSGINYGNSDKNIHKMLLDLDFICCKYYPFERRIEILSDYQFGNNIYIKNGAMDFVSNKILNSPKLTINKVTY